LENKAAEMLQLCFEPKTKTLLRSFILQEFFNAQTESSSTTDQMNVLEAGQRKSLQ
jgi:hypothetical protein